MHWISDLHVITRHIHFRLKKILRNTFQGGHGTGKTGNLAVNFPDRENTWDLQIPCFPCAMATLGSITKDLF